MPDIQETTERKAEIGIGEMYEVLRKRTDDYVRRYRRDFVVFLVVYVLSVAAICAVAYSLIHGAQSAAEGQAVAPALQEHDFIKLFTPIAVLVFGFVITMLGLKRFEQIDDQIRLIRNELIDTLRDGRNDMEAWLKHQLDSTQVSLRNDAEKALKNIEELRENAINEINGKIRGGKTSLINKSKKLENTLNHLNFCLLKLNITYHLLNLPTLLPPSCSWMGKLARRCQFANMPSKGNCPAIRTTTTTSQASWPAEISCRSPSR